MLYLLLFISVCIDTLKNTYYNHFSKLTMRTNKDALLFNVVSCLGAVVYFLCTGAGFAVSSFSFYMSIGFAVVTAGAMYLQLLAMSMGSMSYSVLFTYLSMLIPALFGVIYYGQPVTAMQVVGLVLMIITFVLSVDLKDNAKTGLKWFAAAFGSFIAWGLVGVLQQIQQSSPYVGESNVFLLWSFVFSALIFAVMYLFTPLKKDEEPGYRVKSRITFFVVLSGVFIGAINQINLYLSGAMSSMILFPVLNGGVIILSGLVALLMFREKLSKKQMVGILFGIASVLFLGM